MGAETADFVYCVHKSSRWEGINIYSWSLFSHVSLLGDQYLFLNLFSFKHCMNYELLVNNVSGLFPPPPPRIFVHVYIYHQLPRWLLCVFEYVFYWRCEAGCDANFMSHIEVQPCGANFMSHIKMQPCDENFMWHIKMHPCDADFVTHRNVTKEWPWHRVDPRSGSDCEGLHHGCGVVRFLCVTAVCLRQPCMRTSVFALLCQE